MFFKHVVKKGFPEIDRRRDHRLHGNHRGIPRMEPVLDLLVSICSIATLGQYVWSMRAHFQPQAMSPGAMAISAAVIATALFFLAILWVQSQPV